MQRYPSDLAPWIAHIDEPSSLSGLTTALSDLHGSDYRFGLVQWDGRETIATEPGRTHFLFVIESKEGMIRLNPDEPVRGAPGDDRFETLDPELARVRTQSEVELWPGDVICVDGAHANPATVGGRVRAFEVVSESSLYSPPRLALLRNLTSIPGGCAAYPGAFRRETLPPRPGDPTDPRGKNRVNEHTLDMRYDRTPPPIRHCHGPIVTPEGSWLNHSETAIVLPRSIYGLPEVDEPDRGYLILYRQPLTDPSNQQRIDVRPGSLVVTPATPDFRFGHAFENVFAMLIAIPGFVAPYHMIDDSYVSAHADR